MGGGHAGAEEAAAGAEPEAEAEMPGAGEDFGDEEEEDAEARPSLIPSLCTRFTRAGIVWLR